MFFLRSIELINFVTHKKSFIDFSKGGSYYIFSKFNGSGKSLIFDAISWGLFGKTIRGGHADKIIGKFENRTLVTQIWYSDSDDKYYRICRYRNDPDFKNRVILDESIDNKKWTTLEKETKTDTDIYIQRLFKIDYDLFISSVVLRKPKHFPSFCEAKDSQRKDVLTGILNLSWIDEALKKAKNDFKVLKEEMYESKKLIEVNKALLQESNKLISDFKNQYKIFEDNKVKDIKVLNIKITEATKKIDLSEDRRKINDLYLQKEKYSTEFKERRSLLSDKLKKLMLLQKLLRDKKDKLSNKSNEAFFKLNSSRDLLKKNNSKSEVCEFCGSKIDLSKIENINKQITIDIKNLAGRYNKIEELRKINIDKFSKISSKVISVEEEIRSIQLKQSETTHKIDKEIGLLESNIKFNNSSETKFLTDRIEFIKKLKNPMKKNIAKTNRDITRYSNELVLRKKEFIVLKKKYDDCIYASEVFGNSGLKNDILTKTISILEHKINSVLKKLTEGDIFVSIDNKVSRGSFDHIKIIIQDSKKDKPLEYELWSGGEQTRIRFAIEYSINSILESPINIMIIDEGFDDMDPDGIQRVVDFLKEEKQRNILFVSNRPDMRSMFKNFIEVKVKGEVSSVEQPRTDR